jgi:diguanylate cyclase (GGDEF)-like protein
MASRRSRTVVLAWIDLDAFREINEALGRAGGDAVLVQIAEHLKAGVPAEALFGRFEDDEFAVLMTCDDARGAARSLLRCARCSQVRFSSTARRGLAQPSASRRRPTTARQRRNWPAAPALRCVPPSAKAGA